MSTLSWCSSISELLQAISWAVASPLPPLEGNLILEGLWPLLPCGAGAVIGALGLGPLLPLWAGAVITKGCSKVH